MYGEFLKEAPEGFVPYHQWPEYKLSADVPPFLHPHMAGTMPRGMYRSFWPITVEEYISDDEPVLADSDPHHTSRNRAVIWQRLFRTDTPLGWRHLSMKPPQIEGFVTLHNSEYWRSWSESARRYRKKWLEEYAHKDYTIENISSEEFLAAYKTSTIKPYIRTLYADMVVRKLAAGATMEFIAARHVGSKHVAAAMATIDSPTHKGSYYLCGFIQPAHEYVPAMVGLMDYWHKKNFTHGTRFLHFGRFWQKGDPDDWKGFSLFKSKFGPQYISYPPALWRFVRGRLF